MPRGTVTVSAATLGLGPHKQSWSEWYTFDVVVHQDDEAEIQDGVQDALIHAGVDQLLRETKVAFVRHTSLRLRELYLVGRFASEQEAEPAMRSMCVRSSAFIPNDDMMTIIIVSCHRKRRRRVALAS